MSGRKQHYIPQSILKGFSVPKKKKNYVQVYRKDKVFGTPTEGIAAQRDFYSKPEENNVETLDDVITKYENGPLISAYKNIVEVKGGEIVSTVTVAKLLSHLLVRQSLARTLFAEISKDLTKSIKEHLSKKSQFKKLLDPNHNSSLMEECDKIHESVKGQLPSHLKERAAFQGYVNRLLKAQNINCCREQFNAVFDNFLSAFLPQVDERIKDAHNKALGKDITPQQRVDILSNLTWRMIECTEEHEGLVLPDCVAISLNSGKVNPLVFNNEKLKTAVFPITSQKLLWGSLDGLDDIPLKRINKLFAECSQDFFIATTQKEKYEKLRSVIGKRLEIYKDRAIKGAIKGL